MRVLDRSFFQKRVPLTAARILDNKKISNCRRELEKSKDLLRLERIAIVRPDPEEGPGPNGRKCLLLKPEIKCSGMLEVSVLAQSPEVDSPMRFFHLELQATRACHE